MDSIVDEAIDEAEARENEAAGNNGTQQAQNGYEEIEMGDQSAANGAHDGRGQQTGREDTFTTQSAPNTNPDSGKMTDDQLKEVLGELQTNITVVGCGGAGSNTVNRMHREGITGAKLVAANTDVQHLVDVTADEKILLDDGDTDGRGAGAKPQVGEEAALNTQHDIQDAVQGSDMVFVTAGLGGGTGTGCAPVVAKAAQQTDALTISIVTMPFTSEGKVRRENAQAGLARLRDVSDTVIVVPNDRIVDSVGNLPVRQAFRVADTVLMRAVKGITELITTSGLVNLDFADVSTVMKKGGVAMIGLGESDADTRRAEDAVKDAIRSPLLDVDISAADSVLVNVTGGEDMAIDEAEGVVEEIHERVNGDPRIIWGTSIDESLDDTLRTMMVVTGVESPQMFTGDSKSGRTRGTPQTKNTNTSRSQSGRKSTAAKKSSQSQNRTDGGSAQSGGVDAQGQIADTEHGRTDPSGTDASSSDSSSDDDDDDGTDDWLVA